MAATMATMAILNTKCMTTPKLAPKTTTAQPKTTLLSVHNLPKGLAAASVAGAVFSSLSACEPAFAVHQIADLAAAADGGDSRGLALLLPLVPAVAWVLFNILQPALNQLNRMRESKGIFVGVGGGLGGLAALGLLSAPEASAAAAEAAGEDNRGKLLLIVIAPAVLWVLYNILQPALNQLNRMRSD